MKIELRRIRFILLLSITPVLAGVSGCDDRMKYKVLSYELEKCPAAPFNLPRELKDDEWTLLNDEARFECKSFDSYSIRDTQASSGGGSKPGRGHFVFVRLKKDSTCTLQLGFAIDEVARVPTEKEIEAFADATIRLIRDSTKIIAPARPTKVNEVGKKDDFKSWCS